MSEACSTSRLDREIAATAAVESRPTRWRLWVALSVLFVIFFQLGGRGLNEPDEGRYAEAGREMMASGDYLTPHLNGVPHYAKPPLTYWLIAFSLSAFGVNEFAARLPAALAGLGTLLAVFLMGRRALGEAGGLWSVVILLSSVLFFGVARLITTDMLLTCWVTWSVWVIWRWSESRDRSWGNLLWFYAFLGLGMMTKGPVAVLLPLFAVVGLRWRHPDLRLRQMGWLRGGLVMLAISMPWFLVITWRQPELLHYFLGREIAGRVLSNVHGRSEAWWYFLPVLAGAMLPWTPWLALTPLIRRNLPQREANLLRMCVVWAGAGLALFTLSRSKLPTYILPLMPPLALLGALTLLRLPQVLSAGRLRLASRVCGLISALVLVGAGVTLALVAPSRYELPLALAIIPAAVAVLLAGVALVLMEVRGLSAGVAMLAITVLGVVLSVLTLLPRVERHLDGKTPAKFLAERIRHEDPGQQASVVAFGKLPLGLPFYLNRTVLWYRPPSTDAAAANPAAFEYMDRANHSSTVLDDPERLQAMLSGTNQVFCVASKLEATELKERFDLRELENDGRRVLLVTRERPEAK